jgi:hypothetical protein
MFTLLTKDADFQWSKEWQVSFEAINKKIMLALFVQGPKWNFPFHIHSNASDREIEVVLGKNEEKEPYPIY